MPYSVRLKLYDSTGDKKFTIDQSGELSGDVTILNTERGAFDFNKPCNAAEFTNSSGASLSFLNDFVGVTTNLKNYLDTSVSSKNGSNDNHTQTKHDQAKATMPRENEHAVSSKTKRKDWNPLE